MTELAGSKKVTRKTAAMVRARALIVTVHAGHIELREQGLRRGFSMSYDALYRHMCDLEGRRLLAERKATRKAAGERRRGR